jgi:hypothetical protein
MFKEQFQIKVFSVAVVGSAPMCPDWHVERERRPGARWAGSAWMSIWRRRTQSTSKVAIKRVALWMGSIS